LTSASENTQPVAKRVAVSTPVNTPVIIHPEATDAEKHQLRFLIVNNGTPRHGTLFWTENGLEHRPTSEFAGIDSFSIVAHDTQTFSNSAIISVSVGDLAAGGIQHPEGKHRPFIFKPAP
jgi:hypothetical protein